MVAAPPPTCKLLGFTTVLPILLHIQIIVGQDCLFVYVLGMTTKFDFDYASSHTQSFLWFLSDSGYEAHIGS
jgi:hypothetical protein